MALIHKARRPQLSSSVVKHIGALSGRSGSLVSSNPAVGDPSCTPLLIHPLTTHSPTPTLLDMDWKEGDFMDQMRQETIIPTILMAVPGGKCEGCQGSFHLGSYLLS